MTNFKNIIMKKLLNLLLFFLCSIIIHGQTSVIISGPTGPIANQGYTYTRTSGGALGTSGTKATWTITNGYFQTPDNSKPTTITQNVDLTQVQVYFTKPNQSGTIKFSYSSSGKSYEGFISVLIIPESNTGGGTGGGGSTGAPINLKVTSTLNQLSAGQVATITTQRSYTKDNYIIFDYNPYALQMVHTFPDDPNKITLVAKSHRLESTSFVVTAHVYSNPGPIIAESKSISIEVFPDYVWTSNIGSGIGPGSYTVFKYDIPETFENKQTSITWSYATGYFSRPNISRDSKTLELRAIKSTLPGEIAWVTAKAYAGTKLFSTKTETVSIGMPRTSSISLDTRSLSVEDSSNTPSDINTIRIYNLSGVLVYSNNAVNGTFDIGSTVLTDGIYIIEKFDGENRTSEKVILKR